MNFVKTIKKNPLIDYLFNKINRLTGTILMLHRVVEHKSLIEDNSQLEISVDFLEQTINEYREKGYYFATIDEVFLLQQQPDKNKTPYVCFTFDDGFRDNLTLALPIFEKFQVPFTVYIATGFPDHTVFVWWYWLEILITNLDEVKLLSGKLMTCKQLVEKNAAFIISSFKFAKN